MLRIKDLLRINSGFEGNLKSDSGLDYALEKLINLYLFEYLSSVECNKKIYTPRPGIEPGSPKGQRFPVSCNTTMRSGLEYLSFFSNLSFIFLLISM